MVERAQKEVNATSQTDLCPPRVDFGEVLPDADLFNARHCSRAAIPSALERFAAHLTKHHCVGEEVTLGLQGAAECVRRRLTGTVRPRNFDPELACAKANAIIKAATPVNSFEGLEISPDIVIPTTLTMHAHPQLSRMLDAIKRAQAELPSLVGIDLRAEDLAAAALLDYVQCLEGIKPLDRYISVRSSSDSYISSAVSRKLAASLYTLISKDTESLSLKGLELPKDQLLRLFSSDACKHISAIKTLDCIGVSRPLDWLVSIYLCEELANGLTELSLTSAWGESPRAVPYPLNFHALQMLHIDSSVLQPGYLAQLVSPKHTPRLQSLDLEINGSRLDFGLVFSALRSRPCLRSLRVSGALPHSGLQEFWTFGLTAKLEVLELPHSNLRANDSWILSPHSSLRRLSLAHSSAEPDFWARLVPVVENLPQLHELDLRNTSVTLETLETLLRATSRLRVQVSPPCQGSRSMVEIHELRKLADTFGGTRVSVFEGTR